MDPIIKVVILRSVSSICSPLPFSQNFFLTFAEKSDVLIGVLQHNQTVKKSKKKETGYRPPLECLFYLHNIRYQPKGEKNH